MRTGLSLGTGAAALTLALALSAHADGLADSRLGSGADAYLAKGQQDLARGKAGAAAANLEKAVKLKPTNAYHVLWLHFARNKEGAPDQTELKLNADRVNRAAWPGPLLDYLTGKIDASAVLAKAGEGQDKANRLCDANLFLGQDDLTKGRRSEGLERLQAAADGCEFQPREAQLARANLPGAAPKAPEPILAANRVTKDALLADTTVTSASINPGAPRPAPAKPAPIKAPIQPQARPQTLAQVQGDPLLRGSLR